VAVILLVIGGEVFHGGDDAFALHAANIGGGGLAGEIRIFAEVFEVAAIHGGAVDVDTGTEEEIDAAGARVLPDGLTHGSASFGSQEAASAMPPA
jgi:hypothetical protein